MDIVLLTIALAAVVWAIFWVKRQLTPRKMMMEWRQRVLTYKCELIEQPGESYDLKLSSEVCEHCGAFHWEPVAKESSNGSKGKITAGYIASTECRSLRDQGNLQLPG